MSTTLLQSYIAMLGAIGIVMQNAASNQKNGQMMATSCLSVSCEKSFFYGS